MNDDNKVERSQENIPNLTNEQLPSHQKTHQDENLEIAELKKQIHELKTLMEMQKNNSSQTNTNESSVQDEELDVVTFRDIQRARSIHSVPLSNKRNKNQMFHYYNSHESEEIERTLPRKLRQPLEVRYTSMESKTKKKNRNLPTEELQQNESDSFERLTQPIQAQDNFANNTSETANSVPKLEQDIQAIEAQENPTNNTSEIAFTAPKLEQDNQTIDVPENLTNNTSETTNFIPNQEQDNQTIDAQKNQTNNTTETNNSTQKQESTTQTIQVQDNIITSSTEPESSVEKQKSSLNNVETKPNQNSQSTSIGSDQNLAPKTETTKPEEPTVAKIESNNEPQQTNQISTQKTEPQNETNPSSQVIHTNNNDDKKSVFGYIWGKIK